MSDTLEEDHLYLQEFIAQEKLWDQWRDSVFYIPPVDRIVRSKQRYTEALGRYKELRERGFTRYYSARTACQYKMQTEWSHSTAIEGARVRPLLNQAHNMLQAGCNQETGEVL